MWQRDSAHSGYVAEELLLADRTFAWSEPAQTGTTVRGIAASRDAVFTTGTAVGSALLAQSIVDGHTLWSVPFDAATSTSAPAYAEGLIWLFENHFDLPFSQVDAGYLDAFDAITGASVHRVPFTTNGESVEAPTIANGHVYFVAPAPATPGGGFASVSTATGQVDWLSQSQLGDGHVASVANGYVYGNTVTLNVLDPVGGATVVSIVNLYDNSDQATSKAPVLLNNNAYVTQGSKVVVFDLGLSQYAWNLDNYASGQVATDGQEIFYLSTGALSVHDAATGALHWGWEAPISGPAGGGDISDNFIVTKSHLILTDGANIYFINRTTHHEEASFTTGGALAYAADTLFVADLSGNVTAFRVPTNELFHNSFE